MKQEINFQILFIFLCCSTVISRMAMAPPGHKVTSLHGNHHKRYTVLTESGKECKFPFRYGGRVYHNCISNVFSQKLWCATTHNFDRDRQWGYCGSVAENTHDFCEKNPCQNGGFCTNIPHLHAFKCTCKEEFTGKTCNIVKCYDQTHLRYYNIGETWGRVHTGKVEQCTCIDSLIVCQPVQYTACSTNPCQHEGTCRLIVSSGESVCFCRPGFAGPRCSLTPEAGCYQDNGTNYRGVAWTTISGSTCLPWNSDLLSEEFDMESVEKAHALGLGAHAFCRNPDEDEMPWCYILKETKVSWEYCDILPCVKSVPRKASDPITFIVVKPTPAPVCGKRHKKRIPKGRIIGGSSALPGFHPWLAAIYIGNNFCSGTLIKPCWVVSAAHCFASNPLKSSVKIILGQHYFNDTGRNAVSFEIEKYVFYDQYSVFNPTQHDIVLIKLKKNNMHCARRSQFVQPLCLPENDLTFPDHHCCHIAGWGHMDEKKAADKEIKYAHHLQETVVPLVPFEQCSRPEVYGTELTSNMLCAGYLTDCRRDACQGDSGGPLACEQDGISYLYGIISWGDGCGRTNKPGVYTKVTNYVNWINSIIKPKAQS
ncbi:hepatocyte growth factor activator-like isoform X1 [Polyodon spathula]|uniref:hepatocyte growth factor activator-like isoform X1 n=1 Tax=Polyodon spathula TaxID=7913 RepID=UPI001B7ED208|nr:hepatocyte growth factor activator-like isoform X1 [Polyodon spathula]